MDIDLPAQLQGGGTITWTTIQPLLTPLQQQDVVAYWRATQGTDIAGGSALDIPTMRDYFLNRRLPGLVPGPVG